MNIVPFNHCNISQKNNTYSVDGQGFEIKIPVILGFEYRVNLAGNSDVICKITIRSRDTVLHTQINPGHFNIDKIFIVKSLTTISFNMKKGGNITIDQLKIFNDMHELADNLKLHENNYSYIAENNNKIYQSCPKTIYVSNNISDETDELKFFDKPDFLASNKRKGKKNPRQQGKYRVIHTHIHQRQTSTPGLTSQNKTSKKTLQRERRRQQLLEEQERKMEVLARRKQLKMEQQLEHERLHQQRRDVLVQRKREYLNKVQQKRHHRDTVLVQESTSASSITSHARAKREQRRKYLIQQRENRIKNRKQQEAEANAHAHAEIKINREEEKLVVQKKQHQLKLQIKHKLQQQRELRNQKQEEANTDEEEKRAQRELERRQERERIEKEKRQAKQKRREREKFHEQEKIEQEKLEQEKQIRDKIEREKRREEERQREREKRRQKNEQREAEELKKTEQEQEKQQKRQEQIRKEQQRIKEEKLRKQKQAEQEREDQEHQRREADALRKQRQEQRLAEQRQRQLEKRNKIEIKRKEQQMHEESERKKQLEEKKLARENKIKRDLLLAQQNQIEQEIRSSQIEPRKKIQIKKKVKIEQLTDRTDISNINYRIRRNIISGKLHEFKQDKVIVLYNNDLNKIFRMLLYYRILTQDNYDILLINDGSANLDVYKYNYYGRTKDSNVSLVDVVYNLYNLYKQAKPIYGFSDMVNPAYIDKLINLEQNVTVNNVAVRVTDTDFLHLKDSDLNQLTVPLYLNTNQLKLLKSLEVNNGKINQLFVSSALSRFNNKFLKEYGLFKYSIKHKPAFFFGCYNSTDYTTIMNYKHLAVIIWGGTDSNTAAGKKFIDLKQFNNRNIFHIAISKQIYERLIDLGIDDAKIQQINLRLLNYHDYQAATKLNDSVYIYTSLDEQRADKIYGASVYNEVIERMPDIQFIIAYGQYTEKEIINVYKRCFIGLRLTYFDGSANTVQELGLLGRRCVHNGTLPTSLQWETADDVVNHINIERKKIGMINRNNRKLMLDYLSNDETWLYCSFYDY